EDLPSQRVSSCPDSGQSTAVGNSPAVSTVVLRAATWRPTKLLLTFRLSRALGACPRIRPCLALARGFSPGLGHFGLGPALGAHYPPQLSAAAQVWRQIFSRL